MSGQMVDDNPQRQEAELARQWNEKCAKEARSIKWHRLLYASVFVTAGVMLACFHLYAWGLIVIGCGAVAFVMYLDANGNEHEIQERSSEKLVPGFSSILGPVDNRLERKGRVVEKSMIIKEVE